MSKASDLGYWVKDHGGVVFAAIMVVALVAMFVAAMYPRNSPKRSPRTR